MAQIEQLRGQFLRWGTPDSPGLRDHEGRTQRLDPGVGEGDRQDVSPFAPLPRSLKYRLDVGRYSWMSDIYDTRRLGEPR